MSYQIIFKKNDDYDEEETTQQRHQNGNVKANPNYYNHPNYAHYQRQGQQQQHPQQQQKYAPKAQVPPQRPHRQPEPDIVPASTPLPRKVVEETEEEVKSRDEIVEKVENLGPLANGDKSEADEKKGITSL